MANEWGELRSLLQIIALPVAGQVYLLPDDCCRLEVLTNALATWCQQLPARLKAMLTSEQERVLAQLEQQLVHTCSESAAPMWTDLAMYQSEGLRQSRWLARVALIRFGWLLELPDREFSQALAATGMSRSVLVSEQRQRAAAALLSTTP